MKKIIDTVQRFQVLLGILTMAAGAIAVIVWGFGDTLGIDPKFKSVLAEGAGMLFVALQSILTPILARDSDNDGTPDILENIMNSDDAGSD